MSVRVEHIVIWEMSQQLGLWLGSVYEHSLNFKSLCVIPLFFFVCIVVLVKEGSLFSILVCHLKINIYMYCWKKMIFKTVLEALFLLGFG